MDEEWKIIRNYSDYAISNFGKVKRIKPGPNTYVGKILKLNIDTHGYLYVTFCKNGCRKNFLVHRLVMEAFVGPCPKNKEINHIDGNKENLYKNNLEYVTSSENTKHAFKLGLRKGMKGEKSPASKLKERDILKIRKLYKTGKYTQKEIGRKFNVVDSTISEICNYKIWKHIEAKGHLI